MIAIIFVGTGVDQLVWKVKSRLVGTSAVDHHGAMIFAAGILGALVKKGRTGEVDASMSIFSQQR